jgi:hypothetical protein
MVVVVATALLSRCHGQRNLFIGVGGSAAPPSGCCFCHGQRADAPPSSSASKAHAPRLIASSQQNFGVNGLLISGNSHIDKSLWERALWNLLFP